MDRGSRPQPTQAASTDVAGDENQTTTKLKWKGKAAVTTRQLQAEAEHKITTVATQATKRNNIA